MNRTEKTFLRIRQSLFIFAFIYLFFYLLSADINYVVSSVANNIELILVLLVSSALVPTLFYVGLFFITIEVQLYIPLKEINTYFKENYSFQKRTTYQPNISIQKLQVIRC